MTKAALKRRVARLEKASSCHWADLHEETQKRALEATSDGDLQLLEESLKRRAPFSECRPEEQAAWERYRAEYEAAARTIDSRVTARAVGPRPRHRQRGPFAIQ
jgi:hypothetical protein